MSSKYDFAKLPKPVQDEISRINQVHASRWTFAQGLLVGQLTVIVMIIFFLKFFIFAETAPIKADADRRGIHGSSKQRLKKKKSRVLRGPPPLSAAQILAKTYYNTASHRAESLDWFNVLIAQAFAQFREDALSKDAILVSLDGIVNGPRKPDFLGDIRITEINMGEDFPIFSNCRIGLMEPEEEAEDGKPLDQRLHATMDVDLSDTITLAAETSLLLNYPSPNFVVLPIAMGITISRFSGTLHIALIPPADNKTSTTLTFQLEQDFGLELQIRSLIGSRSKLQDIPKIAQLVESRLRQWLCERVVEPRYQRVDVPSFWPSKARTSGSKDGGVQPESTSNDTGNSDVATEVVDRASQIIGQGTPIARPHSTAIQVQADQARQTTRGFSTGVSS
jgi:maintenance of morphology protein 1